MLSSYLLASIAQSTPSSLAPSVVTPIVKWVASTVLGLVAVWLSVAILDAAEAVSDGRESRSQFARLGGRLGAGRWLALAVLLAIAIVAIEPREIMLSRSEGLGATMLGWDATRRPLVYLTTRGLLRGTFGDDPGLYLLAPLLGGLRMSAPQAHRLLAVIVALALAGTVAWLGRVVQRMPAARLRTAALVPVVAMAAAVIHAAGDVYAFPAVAGLLGLTVLFAESTGRLRTDAALAGALSSYVAVAVVCTLFRGTTVAIAATVVLVALCLFRRQRPARQAMRVAALVALVVAPSLLRGGIARYRDAYFRGREATAPFLDQHLFWHSIYIGLGVAPNRYGIVYRDSSAMNYVQRTDPGARYQSERYETIVRRRVFTIAAEDPLFVARQFLLKAAVLAFPLLIVLPLLPRRARLWRHERARGFLLASGAIVLAGLLPGFLVVPVLNYAVGGVVVLLFVAPLALLVAASGVEWPERATPAAAANGSPDPASRVRGGATAS